MCIVFLNVKNTIDATIYYAIYVGLRDDIEKKLDKLQEPPPLKKIKPLDVPGEWRRKKRGGRRVRKLKEKLAVTELRKQANRTTFGQVKQSILPNHSER